MLIHGPLGIEPVMANITLPVEAVECALGGYGTQNLVFVPSYLFFSDDATRVTLAHHPEDGLAVQTGGARTSTRLEVVSETASGGEVGFAERTDYSRATVGC